MSLLRRLQEAGKVPTEKQMSEQYLALKEKILQRFYLESNIIDFDYTKTESDKKQIIDALIKILSEEKISISAAQKENFVQDLVDEIIGFGPLEKLIRDKTITSVLIKDDKNIYITKQEKFQLSEIKFDSEEHLRRIIEKIFTMMENILVKGIFSPRHTQDVRSFLITIPYNVEDLLQSGKIGKTTAAFLSSQMQIELSQEPPENIDISNFTTFDIGTSLLLFRNF